MYCHTHRCYGCYCHTHQCPVVEPPPLFWCGTCRRWAHYGHHHTAIVWPPPVVNPVIICGPQQRDAATIRALAG